MAEASPRAEKPRVLLMGARRSGKSSIQKVVFHKMSPHETLFIVRERCRKHAITAIPLALTPSHARTQEATNKIVKNDIANSSFVQFEVWDFPGHVDTSSAAVKPESTYGSCGALVWVIDAQDDHAEAISRLQQTIVTAHRINPQIVFEVFIHKVDSLPDDQRIETQREIQNQLSDELATARLSHAKVNFHLTSIYDHSVFEAFSKVVQQLIRPTGVVDPHITVLPTKGQIDDLLERIQGRVKKKERVIVTTLTKRMAEELSSYLEEAGIRVRYLHSEIDTLERIEILRDLRLGVFDVIVGINLLREGIDLPEVTLVAILDADKEGFLRSAWALIQTVGRAARNTGGEVVFYADKMTDSMKTAISETDRRRAIQEQWNIDHGITATTISKPIRDLNDRLKSVAEKADTYAGGKRGGALSEVGRSEIEKLVKQLEAQMKIASKALEFERAAAIRDEIRMLRTAVLEEDAATAIERAAERAAREAQGGSRRGAPAKTAPQGIGAAAHTLVAPALDTAADWLPGLRDEHEEETGTIPDAGQPPAAEAPVRRRTWDPSVTPNVIKRRGERPKRRG